MHGVAGGTTGHGEDMTKLLSDNRVVAVLFIVLCFVNAYAITHGYYA